MREQAAYMALLVGISVVNSVGQVMMRWGGRESAKLSLPSGALYSWLGSSRWWLVGVLVTWSCGLIWAWCLRRVPLVAAMPIYSGLVYVLSVIGGAWLLREKVSSIQGMGIALVLAGLLLLMLPGVPRPHVPTQ